jgi:hypothetical protein
MLLVTDRRSTMRKPAQPCPVIVAFLCLVGSGCGPPGEGGSGGPGAAGRDATGAATGLTDIGFSNHCSATSPDVKLVTPAKAAEWRKSEAAYCVVFEDTPEYYGGFDPLGIEGPCGTGDSVAPWESSKELFAVVTYPGGGSHILHVRTRIEETDDERCVGCYPEEAGCTGGSTFRELSRNVSLAIPEGGGSRVVPLTEIQGLDYEGNILSLELTLELLAGDSIVARGSLAPVWARCC